MKDDIEKLLEKTKLHKEQKKQIEEYYKKKEEDHNKRKQLQIKNLEKQIQDTLNLMTQTN